MAHEKIAYGTGVASCESRQRTVVALFEAGVRAPIGSARTNFWDLKPKHAPSNSD
jgi:hypothetical protein